MSTKACEFVEIIKVRWMERISVLDSAKNWLNTFLFDGMADTL